ncbi:MAG: glycoside hydrolase family 88 protein [Clostridia bacterium]
MQTWADTTFEKLVEKFARSAEVARAEGLIPYIGEGGRWTGGPFDGNSWWTGGFWPGMMWQLYAGSHEERFLQEARRTEELLVNEIPSFTRLNHDVGFMYLLSCGADDRLTGNEQAAVHALHAATLLAGRFNPIGFIRAWNRPEQAGWAIIDCMMNLSLLYWASERTGDPRFAAIARIHADTAIREFVREDGSCNHIVIFDPFTGKALEKPAGQGYAVGSSWSRGQAWALYGFTLSYLNSGEARYKETAERIANYFIANIREDGLTDCDFCQPKGEERIDNIAAACAACGLLELAACVEGERASAYRGAALRMLHAMDELCADWTEQSVGVLTKCTASYHQDGAGRHVNIMYGDYFFVEAICKLRGTDPRFWVAKP